MVLPYKLVWHADSNDSVSHTDNWATAGPSTDTRYSRGYLESVCEDSSISINVQGPGRQVTGAQGYQRMDSFRQNRYGGQTL